MRRVACSESVDGGIGGRIDRNDKGFSRCQVGRRQGPALVAVCAPFPCLFGRYVEPFVGGGAVFFHLYNQGQLEGKEVVLVDRLEELINCYWVVQSQVEDLIAALSEHEPHKMDAGYFTRCGPGTGSPAMPCAVTWNGPPVLSFSIAPAIMASIA